MTYLRVFLLVRDHELLVSEGENISDSRLLEISAESRKEEEQGRRRSGRFAHVARVAETEQGSAKRDASIRGKEENGSCNQRFYVSCFFLRGGRTCTFGET